uniref:Uncharacterized protein n=1 Tax=Tanacetum cinerariifolium TaxID=118510 RepID=A0A6L2MRX3_TANCI|nr:hypothetical protein [Tanacetum cinerariifolium]
MSVHPKEVPVNIFMSLLQRWSSGCSPPQVMMSLLDFKEHLEDDSLNLNKFSDLMRSSLDFNANFYNSLGRASNRCSSSISKTRGVVIIHSKNRVLTGMELTESEFMWWRLRECMAEKCVESSGRLIERDCKESTNIFSQGIAFAITSYESCSSWHLIRIELRGVEIHICTFLEGVVIDCGATVLTSKD